MDYMLKCTKNRLFFIKRGMIQMEHEKLRIVIVDSVECCVLALVIFPMTIQDGWKGSYGARRPLSEEECMKMKEKLFDELSAFGTKYGYRSKNSTSSIRGLIAKSQFSFRLNCDFNKMSFLRVRLSNILTL